MCIKKHFFDFISFINLSHLNIAPFFNHREAFRAVRGLSMKKKDTELKMELSEMFLRYKLQVLSKLLRTDDSMMLLRQFLEI